MMMPSCAVKTRSLNDLWNLSFYITLQQERDCCAELDAALFNYFTGKSCQSKASS
jgi:hypothetical protein